MPGSPPTRIPQPLPERLLAALATRRGLRLLLDYDGTLADIALVTPLRDGMNLVAKEYAVSHLADAGVLILSEFAGAAQELKSALLVNPYDIDQIASALHQAVEMPIEERQERMALLRKSIESNDLHSWSQKFLGALVEGRNLQVDARLSPN